MNARGPEWCRENVEMIVEWLIEESDRRLKQAKDEGKSAGWRLRLGGIGLPGRRLVLRRLVLAAVQRAGVAPRSWRLYRLQHGEHVRG